MEWYLWLSRKKNSSKIPNTWYLNNFTYSLFITQFSAFSCVGKSILCVYVWTGTRSVGAFSVREVFSEKTPWLSLKGYLVAGGHKNFCEISRRSNACKIRKQEINTRLTSGSFCQNMEFLGELRRKKLGWCVRAGSWWSYVMTKKSEFHSEGNVRVTEGFK